MDKQKIDNRWVYHYFLLTRIWKEKRYKNGKFYVKNSRAREKFIHNGVPKKCHNSIFIVMEWLKWIKYGKKRIIFLQPPSEISFNENIKFLYSNNNKK